MPPCPSARESSWSSRWRGRQCGWVGCQPCQGASLDEGSARPLAHPAVWSHTGSHWLPQGLTAGPVFSGGRQPSRTSTQSHRFQRTTSMCQTWAKYPRLMCRPTCPTCLALPMTSRTVLTWAQASPPLPPVPSQNCLPSLQRSLSLSRQVSWELEWELAQGAPPFRLLHPRHSHFHSRPRR